MKKTSNKSSHSLASDYFADAALALMRIRETSASGRLSLRNAERFALAHLYFKGARLVHVIGGKGDGVLVLNELLTWTRGFVRFDPGIEANYAGITWEQGELFLRWLSLLEMHAVVHGISSEQLAGLTRYFSTRVPGKPISLPSRVENYEEHQEPLHVQQWQHLNENVQTLIERTLPEEQREQLARISQLTVQQLGEVMTQAGRVTHQLRRRALLATQAGARQLDERIQHLLKQAEQIDEQVPGRQDQKSASATPLDALQSIRHTISQIDTQAMVIPLQPRTPPQSESL